MAFDMSRRTRKTHLKQAMKLVGAPVHEYVIGRGKAQMTTTAWVVIGVFVLAFLFFLAQGVVIFPGVILAVVVANSVAPHRGLAVTDYEVVLLKRSVFNSRPNGIITRLSHAAVTGHARAKRVQLEFAGESVRVAAKEFDRLLAAIATHGVSADHAPPPRPELGWASPYPTLPPPTYEGTPPERPPGSPAASDGWSPLA